MFRDRKLTTYQKEILLAYEADKLLLKVKDVNNKDYIFISNAVDYCWKWIERRQVDLNNMLDILDSEDGYDISYYVNEFERDEKKQEVYDNFFNIILFIGGRAISYEGYSIPYYFDEIYYDPKFWDKIVTNILKIDPDLEKNWNSILEFYDKERENISRSIKWIENSLEGIELTFLEDDEEYSTIQKETLILYVANEIIKELEGDKGYKSCYEGLNLCLEWIMYREVDYKKLVEIIENKNDLLYYLKKEENIKKRKVYQILFKIFKYELLQIMKYENISIDSLRDELNNLNYWEELETEIVEFDKEWKDKLAKVFTLFFSERKLEYKQEFSLRETLKKL
ncbi:hypothetical protein BCR32DRAFT_295929 [Anaeromyces robustus]|uniref:Uncharacterized protein n=1 Tax=Anaeromyces robustus TaxID=1754192 RepID=A0A1Y1WTT2_9FUNG|nr:hypothetical protein BCR32DRAFT_295929 [Anaeromyces robustus]|eukprot:ORX76933.1 hypothetical protein BCR32DRAFT_295929 [Anaeromyces robustus]